MNSGIVSEDGLMTERGSIVIPEQVLDMANNIIQSDYHQAFPKDFLNGNIKDIKFDLWPIQSEYTKVRHVIVYCHPDIIGQDRAMFSLTAEIMS